MRQKIVAGNWKMNTSPASAPELARAIATGVGTDGRVAVIVFPPFPFLGLVRDALTGSSVQVGAQNAYCETKGAFTGEVSPLMLAEVGCRYVILGHSERRRDLGETDDFINRKIKPALEAGLTVILCVGETLAEHEAGQTEAVLERQFQGSLANVTTEMLQRMILAYEPVWAINTGRAATPDQAQSSHAYLRGRVAERYGANAAETLQILYGGSVNQDNVESLASQADVDGGLIGGASLKANEFLKIVEIVRGLVQS